MIETLLSNRQNTDPTKKSIIVTGDKHTKHTAQTEMKIIVRNRFLRKVNGFVLGVKSHAVKE